MTTLTGSEVTPARPDTAGGVGLTSGPASQVSVFCGAVCRVAGSGDARGRGCLAVVDAPLVD
ncbi:hypothetical protein [Frankia canadensis]|uniref:hypothetical protein n=1 Tax=Frankia canadensis TaxID=1836972 RepID=UPI000C797789|nr:hypothetical protein [Frankia canadensis]